MTGTHNSMTFAKPYHWYGWLMIPFARCQRKNLRQQLDAGARCFDLRIRFDKKGNPYFAHGAMRVKGDVQDSVEWLFSQAKARQKKLLARIILEERKENMVSEVLFVRLCRRLFNAYASHVLFFGGRRKGDWKELYNFGTCIELNQYVGSMADDARWYERIMPFAYARRKNKTNMQKALNDHPNTINLFDFI